MFYAKAIADLGSPKYTNATLRSAVRAYRPDHGQPIGDWDVSEVTDMEELFLEMRTFNEDISNWDVSKVTNMRAMFRGAVVFNQPLNAWDVSHVTNFSYMFSGAESFNQPLDRWNTSAAIYMNGMFDSARTFNQPLHNWDLHSVITISHMFADTLEFNQPLDQWDVTHIRSNSGCFANSCYQQPIRWTLPPIEYPWFITRLDLLGIVGNWIIALYEPTIQFRHQLARIETDVRDNESGRSVAAIIRSRIFDRRLVNPISSRYQRIRPKIETFIALPTMQQLLAELDQSIDVNRQIEIFNTALSLFEATRNRSKLLHTRALGARYEHLFDHQQLHDSYQRAAHGRPIQNDPINPLAHVLRVIPIDEYLLPPEVWTTNNAPPAAIDSEGDARRRGSRKRRAVTPSLTSRRHRR